MIAHYLRPISMVANAGFLAYSRALNPDYKVPCPTTVAKYVKALYNELKPKVMEEMSGQQVALTTDLWTSMATDSYITITCHFVSNSWEMRNLAVATRPFDTQHSGDNIRTILKAIADEFEITCLAGVVTDNATNMVASMSTGELGLHIRCFAHTLQLAVNDGMKLPAISKATAAARRLVGHFNHSAQATKALKDAQLQQLGADDAGKETCPLTLAQDVATRWNSTFLMMQRLLQLRVPVYAVIFGPHTKNSDRMSLDVSDSYWATMEAICPVLEPLAEATELLATESSPTLSSVHVLLKSLWEALNSTPGEAKVASDLKNKIRDGLKKRFNLTPDGLPSDASLTTPAMMATALDPRYKTLRFLPQEKRTRVFEAVEALLDDRAETAEQEDLPVAVPALAVKQESYDSPSKKLLLSCLAGDVVDLTQGQDSSVSQEVRAYRDAIVSAPNPLLWWKLHRNQFPNLAKLARKYLGIPATEVPSERAFSAAGQTITKLRASLDPETVDSILFIKKNYDFSHFECVKADNNIATETQQGANTVQAAHSLPTLD